MKRVVLFRNGHQTDGKVVLVSNSIEELLQVASKKLGFTAKKVFTEQGGEIDDFKLLRDDDVLYVTGDEPFIRVDVANSNKAPSFLLRDAQKPPSPSKTPPPSTSGRALNPRHSCWAQSLYGQRQTMALRGKRPSEEDTDSEAVPAEPPPDQPKLQDWVKLNVGGKHFCTSRSTLVSKEPASMLARMFNSNMFPSNMDENGAYLIDRSPTYFEPILNYLRNGQLVFDNNINPEGLLAEARFFGIERLVCHLEHLIANQQRSQDLLPLSRRDVINALIITPFTTELRFQGVNLAGSDLSRLDLRHINFKYACLHGCRLVSVNLSWCILERADLSHAIIESAQLVGVKMLCANLEGANLRNCNFEDPNGQRTNMESVNLKGANLEGSNMAGVNLRVATLKNANLQNCDLRGAVLAGADLENCDLSGSDLHEANLRGANLKDAAFELMVTPLHMAQAVR